MMPCIDALEQLSFLYEIGTDFSSLDQHQQLGNTFTNALHGLEFVLRTEFIGQTFRDLLKAVQQREEKEVRVTSRPIVFDAKFNDIFFFEQQGLLAVAQQAGFKGCQDIFATLERSDIPLLELEKAKARKVYKPTDTKSGAMIMTLPTKIPEVDAKFIYPPTENFPRISLISKPIAA